MTCVTKSIKYKAAVVGVGLPKSLFLAVEELSMYSSILNTRIYEVLVKLLRNTAVLLFVYCCTRIYRTM